MNKKRFIIFIFLNLITLLIMYITSFYYQLGANVESESWVEPMYQIKDKKALDIGNQNKIIIVSGSNSLFGINSEKISEITNKPVLNLAVHAGLDIDFLYYKIKKYIKPNDIIVMPLEYGHYTRNGYPDWFINNILVWSNDYFYNLSFVDKTKFIFNLNVDRLLLGLKHKINGEIYKSPENIIKDLTKIIDNEGERWRGYNYKSSNLDGDINVDEPNKVKIFPSYITNDLSPSKHFLNTYNKIVDLVKQKNANLILTHPVTFRSDNYNLDTLFHQQKVDKFMLKMKEYGIQIECNPALFHLSKEFAFDTINHPNKYGALIRSENLANCINGIVNKNLVYDFSYSDAVIHTKQLENKYNALVKRR